MMHENEANVCEAELTQRQPEQESCAIAKMTARYRAI